MPQPDPLDNIMGMLRNQGAIDPNTQQTRQSRMRQDRRRAGAAPGAQLREGARNLDREPHDELSGTLEDIGESRVEEGKEGDIQVGQQDMMPIIQDQLNETILSLKIQIHRERDKERRQQLEQQAEKIRQQVVDLGGEPIWADESVEEGLQKLKGHGQIGAPQIQDEIARIQEQTVEQVQGMPQHQQMLDQVMGQQTQYDQPEQPVDTMTQETTMEPIDPVDSTLQELGITPGEEAPIREIAERAGAYVDWDSETGEVSIQGEDGTATRLTPDRVEGGMAYASGDALGQALRDVGILPEAPSYPDQIQQELDERLAEFPDPPDLEDPQLYEDVRDKLSRVDPGSFNEFAKQYGIKPRTQEEIAEKAELIARRQAEGKIAPLERELERFEENFPNEFEKAKQQIEEHAAQQSADIQEEMSSRGMYYSSVMGNRLGEVDERTADTIAEISRDAAEHVANLRAEIRDIEQWRVLEEEIIRRELETEDRQQRKQLAQMHQEAVWRHETAVLDEFHRSTQRELDNYHAQIQGIQARAQESDRLGQYAAKAYMADHPLIRDSMKQQGITNEQLANMPLEQQANIVQNMLNYHEINENILSNRLNTMMMIADDARTQERHELEMEHLPEQMEMEREQWEMQKRDIKKGWEFQERQLALQEAQLEMSTIDGAIDDLAEVQDWDSVHALVGVADGIHEQLAGVEDISDIPAEQLDHLEQQLNMIEAEAHQMFPSGSDARKFIDQSVSRARNSLRKIRNPQTSDEESDKEQGIFRNIIDGIGNTFGGFTVRTGTTDWREGAGTRDDYEGTTHIDPRDVDWHGDRAEIPQHHRDRGQQFLDQMR